MGTTENPPAGDDEVGDEGHDDGGDTAEVGDAAEKSFKKRIAVTLAVLAVLISWIAILQTEASTNEAAAARESTRLAADAQAAAVAENGAVDAAQQAGIEIDLLPFRPVFNIDDMVVSVAGVELDPDRPAAREEEATAVIEAAVTSDGSLLAELQVEARRLSLTQTATVEERIVWNARSSQYETVMTVAGVAIFLVGFAVVVSRRVRPPLALPGLLLALFCLGWTVQIYLKPIPSTDPAAVLATAEGEAFVAQSKSEESVAAFTRAIELDDEYAPAYAGRGLANFEEANPDLLNTLAITETTGPTFEAAAADIDRAIELGADDRVTLTVAAYVALAAGDYDVANERLTEAAELGQPTPGLLVALSAVALARGDEDAATAWRDEALVASEALAGTNAGQGLLAQYLTLLERVRVDVPAQDAAATKLASETIAAVAANTAGRDLGTADAGAGTDLVFIEFDDGVTTLQLDSSRVPGDQVVTIVGFERPGPDAPWVQTVELFYSGPPGIGERRSLPTPRKCEPVEYRFDIYVEATFVDTLLAPGVDATC